MKCAYIYNKGKGKVCYNTEIKFYEYYFTCTMGLPNLQWPIFATAKHTLPQQNLLC